MSYVYHYTGKTTDGSNIVFDGIATFTQPIQGKDYFVLKQHIVDELYVAADPFTLYIKSLVFLHEVSDG